MADKRISQLVERINIANNDVLPIVASGATTTNKVTISTIQDWMQDNLDVGVTSVGLSMPSAFTVTNSPVTTSGNISVVGAGTVSQYIRGDGSLADFPQGGGGGGSSVNYYLNGSVSQGTIGGVAYLEMNKTPILGAGTDFTINADGYIASFITDAGDPALLEIPAGNWNFETYLQASSAGGTPSFYIELYKVNSGGTATLIASNSATPELIAFGTSTTPYFSALAVPTTTLALTDRLALRYYVTHSGRTITLHTENNTLCQIITTFTTGLTALNGLTAQVQNFATGTSGSDFNISSASTTHTFNLPTATSTIRGALSSTDWSTFNGKQNALNGTGFVKISGTTISYDNSTYLTTGTAASTYLPLAGGTLTGGLNGTSANFSGSVGIGTNTPEGSGLTVASGGILVSLDPGANRKVLELYATSTGAKVSSSYVGASSYGNLELLTSGLARLTLASTGAATFSSSVGIGTSPSALLHLRNGNTEDVSGSIIRMDLSGINPYWEIQARNGVNGANRKLGFFTSVTSSDVMTLTQAGNVGIGTTSPLSKLNVEVASNTDGIFLSRSGTNKQSILILADTSNGASISGGTNPDGTATATDGFGRLILQNGPDEGFIFQTSAVAAGSAQNWQTRMRIRNNGNVFINHPTDVGEGKLRVSQDGALWNVEVRHTFSTQYFMLFRYNSTGIGSIVGNGSSVAFNTTSDYRLKEDLKEIKGLEKLSALKVYDFKFKNSENRMDGVLAHELAEVLPYAVTGEKDAVDVDGNIKPQGVDYSKIVPILIKAIQELKTEIDSLKNQIK